MAVRSTILELVREIVTDLAADGRKVKVCVQQALGQGVFQVTPLKTLSQSPERSRCACSRRWARACSRCGARPEPLFHPGFLLLCTAALGSAAQAAVSVLTGKHVTSTETLDLIKPWYRMDDVPCGRWAAFHSMPDRGSAGTEQPWGTE